MKSRNYQLLFLVFILLFNFGCTTSKTRTVKEGTQSKDVALRKIMILSLGGNYDNRKLLESELTYYINDFGYEAQSSIKYLPEKLLPSTDKIVQVLENNEFDGILVIELVDLAVKDRFVNAKQNYVANPNSPTFYNYFDIYRNRYSVGYQTKELSYVLETRVFDTANKEVVFDTTTKTIQQENLDLAMEDFAKKIAQGVKKSKILVKTK